MPTTIAHVNGVKANPVKFASIFAGLFAQTAL